MATATVNGHPMLKALQSSTLEVGWSPQLLTRCFQAACFLVRVETPDVPVVNDVREFGGG